MPFVDVRATGRLNLSSHVDPFGLFVSAFISMPPGPLDWAGFCMLAGAVVGTQFDVAVFGVSVVPVAGWVAG